MEVVNLGLDLLNLQKLKNYITYETKVTGEKKVREAWKWLAYKDNAMETMDVDENSQGELMKDHRMAKKKGGGGIEALTNSFHSPKAYRRKSVLFLSYHLSY